MKIHRAPGKTEHSTDLGEQDVKSPTKHKQIKSICKERKKICPNSDYFHN